MTINLIAVALYALNIWLRMHGSAVAGLPLLLSIIAVAGLGVSGWLGGQLAYRYGVRVAREQDQREAFLADARR
jgi:uncharacterized membrane protein